jgi:hypothetical protein
LIAVEKNAGTRDAGVILAQSVTGVDFIMGNLKYAAMVVTTTQTITQIVMDLYTQATLGATSV